MRRERLDDGTVVEDLVVEVDGEEYRGTFRICRVDRTKSAFEVVYREYFHQDTSLFAHSAVEQMRLHARFVLKALVAKERESDDTS